MVKKLDHLVSIIFLDESIIDLTNDEEDEETNSRENTSSTEAGSEPNIESDEAMAWRLMQEEANDFSMSQRRRSERLSQNSNSPGTSGQVNYKSKAVILSIIGSKAHNISLER